MSDNLEKPHLNSVQINSVRIMVNREGRLVLDRYIRMDDVKIFDQLFKLAEEDIRAML